MNSLRVFNRWGVRRPNQMAHEKCFCCHPFMTASNERFWTPKKSVFLNLPICFSGNPPQKTVFFLGGLLLYVYRWLFVHFKLISYKTFVAGRMWEAVYPVYSLLWLKLVLMELFADRIWCDLTWSCPLTGWWIVCIFVSWRRNTDPPLRGQSCLSCNSKEGDLHPSLGVASTRRADLDDNADGAKPFFQPDLRLETWFESRRRRQEPLYVLVCPDGQRRRLFGRKIACVFWEACGGMQSQKIVSSNLSLIWENARQ